MNHKVFTFSIIFVAISDFHLLIYWIPFLFLLLAGGSAVIHDQISSLTIPKDIALFFNKYAILVVVIVTFPFNVLRYSGSVHNFCAVDSNVGQRFSLCLWGYMIKYLMARATTDGPSLLTGMHRDTFSLRPLNVAWAIEPQFLEKDLTVLSADHLCSASTLVNASC